ncbi:MAG TPA: hypothetical protein VFE53_19700 [Mucilaginibacter sp.]|jgi:hypothetical protein|nr:hypothetical protein [Mucilaginibacter sp.]
MKAQKSTKAKKLLTRFDHELRELLINDLMRFTFNQPLLTRNTQAAAMSALLLA